MEIKRHKMGPRLSQAVVHNNPAWLAGMVASDASAGAQAQTEQILKQIDETLAAVAAINQNCCRPLFIFRTSRCSTK